MKVNLEKEAVEIEEKIISIGSDLSVAVSLVKFLDLSINDEFEVSNKDIANLAIILRNHINNIVDRYDDLETALDL